MSFLGSCTNPDKRSTEMFVSHQSHFTGPFPARACTLDASMALKCVLCRLLTLCCRSFEEFAFHLHTNTIGPIITAQKLLQSNIPIGTIVFMSSDSGSHGNFREMEDGFAAYAASKSALNMAVRHMAAELKRKDDDTIILAMHPGEVQTDMANISLAWEVHGVIQPNESVTKMIDVIQSKGIQHSGTFWTYENKVSLLHSI